MSELFLDLAPEDLRRIEPELVRVLLPGGQTLFREGDPGDSVYVVGSGRLRATRAGRGGREEVVGEVGRGECVGELAMLGERPRTATVRALRDCTLVRLSKESFDRLVAAYPETSLRLARMIVRRYEHERYDTAGAGAVASIALVPIAPANLLPELASRLTAALTRLDTTGFVSAADVDELFGAGAAQVLPGDPLHSRLASWLEKLEAGHRYTVYLADAAPTPWSQRCLRQADRIVLLAVAGESPEPRPIERELDAESRSSPLDLVLVHPQRAAGHGEVGRWLEPRPGVRLHHVRGERSSDFASLARRLTDRAVGIALSGGGSRGAAHVGMLRALREAQVPIDLVAGSSAGAIVGAMWAMGWEPRQMLEAIRRFAGFRRHFFDLGPPYVSLLSGRAARRTLRSVFGKLDVEDLWLPLAIVSTNLTRAEPHVHMRGPLWLALRASTSLPGIWPPVEIGGELFVDGGFLKNLPADLLREPCAGGRVIACDVSQSNERLIRTHYGHTLSGWRLLANRLNPFARRIDVPSLTSILSRAGMLYSVRHASWTISQNVDLYLAPPMSDFGSFDPERSEALDAVEERGYRFACEQLEGSSLT